MSGSMSRLLAVRDRNGSTSDTIACQLDDDGGGGGGDGGENLEQL